MLLSIYWTSSQVHNRCSDSPDVQQHDRFYESVMGVEEHIKCTIVHALIAGEHL